LKAIKIVKDPEAFQLLADDTRRQINHLLRAKEMAVSQIASELNLTAQAIYHHIRKMKAAGLIEVSREERVGHFIETYYRSAAEVFQFQLGEGAEGCCQVEQIKEALVGLNKIGLISKPAPETVSRVVEIMMRLERIYGRNKHAEEITEFSGADILVKQTMMEFSRMLNQTNTDVKELDALHSELRDILASMAVSKKAKAKSA
jgi:DNA-binding transcriptional ArsR family regulator